MKWNPILVFIEGEKEPISIAQLSEKSGLDKRLLRNRNGQILNAGQTKLHKGKRRAVFTKDDLRPVGAPSKSPKVRLDEKPKPSIQAWDKLIRERRERWNQK